MVEVIKSHFCPHNSQSQNELDTLYFCNLQFHLLSEEGSVGVSVKCRTFTTYLYIMTQKSVDWCLTVGVRHCRAENSVECPGSMIYSVVILVVENCGRHPPRDGWTNTPVLYIRLSINRTT